VERLAHLTERIRDALLDRIKRAEIDPQGRLPSEAELAEEFKVSRTTIRNSLSMLANQGIIVRKQGSGTFVNHAMLNLLLEVSEQWEFSDLIQNSGYEPGIRFVDREMIHADREICSALEVEIGDPVLQIRKIFTANNKPAIFSIAMLSLERVKPPHDEIKLRGPIFPYLAESYNLNPAYSVAEVVPRIATSELTEMLAVAAGTAILLMKDVFLDQDNQPIMYAHNYYNDILRFKAIRQPSASYM
jgi:GntR family transcriptional regulator